MRGSLYEDRIIYRDASDVVARLRAKADADRITFSELLRRAARRELAAIQ